jgi:hypothetical protein
VSALGGQGVRAGIEEDLVDIFNLQVARHLRRTRYQTLLFKRPQFTPNRPNRHQRDVFQIVLAGHKRPMLIAKVTQNDEK